MVLNWTTVAIALEISLSEISLRKRNSKSKNSMSQKGQFCDENFLFYGHWKWKVAKVEMVYNMLATEYGNDSWFMIYMCFLLHKKQ